jgi:hypothetical protein
MKKHINILIIGVLFLSGKACYASDGFDKVKCGADIPKALIGQLMPNESVVVLERKHKALGLKDLGADIISEKLNTIYWMICGKRFIVLQDGNFVRDVMQISTIPDDASEYTGKCKSNDTELPEIVFAILENKIVKSAWEINRKKGFVKLPTNGLQCQ